MYYVQISTCGVQRNVFQRNPLEVFRDIFLRTGIMKKVFHFATSLIAYYSWLKKPHTLVTRVVKKYIYGKVRVLFSARQLVSARKSHSSGVRGPVVRCLLFDPGVSCSNPCVCAIFFTSIPKQKVHFFGTMRFPLFFNVSKGPSLRFFLIFCNRTDVKKSRRVPFRFFGTMRLKNSLSFFCFFFGFF